MSFELASIKSVTSLIYRYPSFYGMEKFDHGVPVIRGEHLNADGCISTVWTDYWFVSPEYSAQYPKTILQLHDVVMSVRGTVGTFSRVGSAHIGTQISPNLIRLVPDPAKIFPPYFYYALRGGDVVAQIAGSVASSAVPALKASDIKASTIRLPSMAEQVSAATTLAVLDDRITLLRETNATLEAIAQALFKSWFVDFDPVRAKMEGRAREGMDEATAALFPDGLDESELGLVPRGWRVGTLADLSELNPESWTAKNHPYTVAYIDLANAKDNEIASVAEFTYDNAPSRARRVLRDGDTIVGTVRPGNRSFAFIHEPASNLTASTGFAVLRPNAFANAEFVYLAATQDNNIEQLAHVADGGAYPAVRPDVVSSLQCVVPGEPVLQAFHVVAGPLLAKVAENQSQAQTLATLRDTLLPRLISGQLRLPEAESSVMEPTP